MKFKNKVWGLGWWTGTTSPSLTQHLCSINMGCSNNLGNVGGLSSQEVLLWQRENHMKKVDLRERKG